MSTRQRSRPWFRRDIDGSTADETEQLRLYAIDVRRAELARRYAESLDEIRRLYSPGWAAQ